MGAIETIDVGDLLERLERACRERTLHPYRVASLTEKTAELRRAFAREPSAALGATLAGMQEELHAIESGSDDFLLAARDHFDRVLAIAFAARAANRLDEGHIQRIVERGIEVLGQSSIQPSEVTYSRMSALEAVVLQEIERNTKVGSELRARIHC